MGETDRLSFYRWKVRKASLAGHKGRIWEMFH